MQAGRNRHLVSILKPAVGPTDEYGHSLPADATHAPWYANIEPLSGREYWRAAQVQSDVTHMISGRWVEGVTPQMKVRHGTRIFNILSAINVNERNREMQLMCKESRDVTSPALVLITGTTRLSSTGIRYLLSIRVPATISITRGPLILGITNSGGSAPVGRDYMDIDYNSSVPASASWSTDLQIELGNGYVIPVGQTGVLNG